VTSACFVRCFVGLEVLVTALRDLSGVLQRLENFFSGNSIRHAFVTCMSFVNYRLRVSFKNFVLCAPSLKSIA
jgi:hypothetical protein